MSRLLSNEELRSYLFDGFYNVRDGSISSDDMQARIIEELEARGVIIDDDMLEEAGSFGYAPLDGNDLEELADEVLEFILSKAG